MTESASPPAATASKAAWRAWARTLPPVPPATASRIVDHLHAFLADVDDPVLAYVALPDEVDIARLLRPGGLRGDVVLPRIDSDGTMSLRLDTGERERASLGMDQPTANHADLHPALLGAVVVPGRAFDAVGIRLGRGGGHYDRLIPHLDPEIPVIGVTTDARQVDRLPREDHDQPMTHVVTESGVRPLRS